MASMKTRKDRVHYAVCQCKLFRNSAASTSSSVENELNFEDFWKFYVKYMDQLFGAKVSSSQRTELEKKMEKRVESLRGNYLTAAQIEVIQNSAPDEGRHLTNSLLMYFDFTQKREMQRIEKIENSKKQLPIFKYRDEVLEVIRKNQVSIVAGDTGCGKSTQLPQYLMDAGYTKIACTQPRRIACISLAKRVAYETFNNYGEDVGYQIRFETCKNAHTRILFLTEGVLLRQIQGAPDFDLYNVIVLDEVHERHLTTDFLLGRLYPIELKYQPVQIEEAMYAKSHDRAKIVTSASLEERYNPESSSADSDKRSGRKQKSKHADIDVQPFIQVLQMIDKRYPSSERGDCLVFLSGINEIMAVHEAIQNYAAESKRWISLPLHSSLSIEQQDAVFNVPPEGVRKCVLSTNIAETSVTIDGIRFVIDSGKMKEISYDTTMKIQRLQEFWVSKASAEQRKGRAGRTGPGLCIRLYSEVDFDSFQPYSTPELQRVSLDAVILQMASMGLQDARRFPFLEAPAESAISSAVTLLEEHGALDRKSKGQITALGHLLSHLPVDITIGKMMLMASLFHTVDAVLNVAAGLSTLSVFTHKSFRSSDAKDLVQPLLSNHGDPFTLLTVIGDWLDRKRRDGNEGARRWCRKRGIEEQRLYEINKLKNQFTDILSDAKFVDKREENDQEKSTEEKSKDFKDRKRLKDMKRSYDKVRKKRKVLSIQDDAFQMQSSDEDEHTAMGASIRDLEFQIKNDLNSQITPHLSLKDISMLKVIMCHGLYPNYALPDSNNGFRKASEQLFNTKHKKFLSLHPSSSLINFPEYFELKPEDHEPNSAMAKSADHQLVVFSHILATKKPFIVNSFRTPALQTLLLFATQIETNSDCSVLLFDEWVEITVDDGDDLLVDLLSSAVKLRNCWDELLRVRLSVFKKTSIESEMVAKPKAKELERQLISKLTKFLHTTIEYRIKVRSSVTMDLYVQENVPLFSIPKQLQEILEESQTVISKAESREEPTASFLKGGFQVTPYLSYGCLAQGECASLSGHLQTVWTCEMCDVTMAVTSAQRRNHRNECRAKLSEGQKDDHDQDDSESKDSQQISAGFFCKECNSTLHCSLVEFMRHRKSHSSLVKNEVKDELP
ncbi:putative ATP-dependent RNA helicase DHX34 isoform X2 [Convolutriloba macropyga]|uniref:putative ATP-dependent RNA helicase DHX34 isoform X2 n=1 Tax=Convolutriloba macropyga TaxID=536237 RepID=UPI003F5236FC